ncbi:MAG TPA: hypothetical protein VIL36_15895 [Acidimicrobiales bacterium]
MRLTIEDEITSMEGVRYRVKVEPAPDPEERSVWWVTVHRPPAPWPVLRERWATEADATARADELKERCKAGTQLLTFAPALRRTPVQSRPAPRPDGDDAAPA